MSVEFDFIRSISISFEFDFIRLRIIYLTLLSNSGVQWATHRRSYYQKSNMSWKEMDAEENRRIKLIFRMNEHKLKVMKYIETWEKNRDDEHWPENDTDP